MSYGVFPAELNGSAGHGDQDEPHDKSFEERAAEVLVTARFVFEQNTGWVTFFREVLGVDGLIGRAFPVPSDRAAFEHTEAWGEISAMLGELRKRRRQHEEFEPTRVITVRLPKSVHDALKDEAHRVRTSLNVLAVSKLLQSIDADLVPPSDY